jgi:hypothetical protein
MLFFRSDKLRLNCCFCAKVMRVRRDTDKCIHCGAAVPDRCKDFPTAVPFFVPLMGWSSVGKTVWLLAVIRRLRDLAATIWDDFSPIPAYEPTLHKFRDCEEMIRSRNIPSANRPHEEIVPQVTVLHQTPRWGDRTFVMRDCSGESFEEFTIQHNQASFLQETQIAFCMISLPDLWNKANKRKSMEEILQCYIHTLGKGCNLREQHRKFVVIFSKSDEMQREMPPHLYDYLIKDPVTRLVAHSAHDEFDEMGMARYMEELDRVSNEIRDWIATKPDGKQFLTLAKAYNMDLRFTITSALGCPAPGGKLSDDWTPYRVLDPLFWALEFHSV